MPTLRQIAQLGNQALRDPAIPVEFPVSDGVRLLVEDLIATMSDADGVGIAAPQVYDSASLFIVASRPNPRYPDAVEMEPEVVINPEILERSDTLILGWEGCLSIPGLRGNVPRHQSIKVRYQTLEGTYVEKTLQDFIARIFQHEYDHLRGIVFLDRLESPKDIMMEKEYRNQFMKTT